MDLGRDLDLWDRSGTCEAMLRRSLVVSFILLNLGCGSGDSVSGIVQGVGLSAKSGSLSATMYTSPIDVLNIRYSALITLTNTDDACAASQEPNLASLSILVESSSPLSEGTYPITPNPTTSSYSQAGFDATNGACAEVFDGGTIAATAGSVVFSSLDNGGATIPNSISGTFFLSFGRDQLSGSFNVSTCNSTDAGPGAATCG
jgi:hypothetical protein